MQSNTLQQRYLVENDAVDLAEIKESNSFDDNDEMFQTIAAMQISETIGEGLNMATITRIS